MTPREIEKIMKKADAAKRCVRCGKEYENCTGTMERECRAIPIVDLLDILEGRNERTDCMFTRARIEAEAKG